jgi:hypothetical protein
MRSHILYHYPNSLYRRQEMRMMRKPGVQFGNSEWHGNLLNGPNEVTEPWIAA